MGNPTPFDVDDIWEHIEPRVDRTDSCWLWSGSTDRNGYGRLRWHGEIHQTHRVAYQALTGDIPEDLEIDHLCRVRRCCNPEHLEPVTHAENMRRGELATRSRCSSGHEYTEANTYRRRDGARVCRACKRTWAARAKTA